LVTSDEAIFIYKVDNYYAPEYDRAVRFDDPSIRIDWHFPTNEIVVSDKDKNAQFLKEAEVFKYGENYYE